MPSIIKIETAALKSLRNRLVTFLDSGTDIFVWILRNFQNIFFVEHSQTSATELNCIMLAFPVISKMCEDTSI